MLSVVVLSLLVLLPIAEAQPREKIPVVGVLSPAYASAASDPKVDLYHFMQGLRDLGYVEGETIHLEYRFADYQLDRLPILAAELVRLTPDVIFTYTSPGTRVATQATTTIPIVIGAGPDLVRLGLVASLARPGGNLTGQILRGSELAGKRLELLKEAVPTISHVAVLVNPANPGFDQLPRIIEPEARALGVQLLRVEASSPEAFPTAFATMAHRGIDALMIGDDSMFNTHRHRLLELALAHGLPTVSGQRPYAEAGSLLDYGPSLFAMFRRAAVYVDKILKGAAPGDLPVEQSTVFELVVNLKTAKALGLMIPPSLLFQADEVIK
jgi:putative ABC transport system substrate-binding protein